MEIIDIEIPVTKTLSINQGTTSLVSMGALAFDRTTPVELDLAPFMPYNGTTQSVKGSGAVIPGIQQYTAIIDSWTNSNLSVLITAIKQMDNITYGTERLNGRILRVDTPRRLNPHTHSLSFTFAPETLTLYGDTSKAGFTWNDYSYVTGLAPALVPFSATYTIPFVYNATATTFLVRAVGLKVASTGWTHISSIPGLSTSFSLNSATFTIPANDTTLPIGLHVLFVVGTDPETGKSASALYYFNVTRNLVALTNSVPVLGVDVTMDTFYPEFADEPANDGSYTVTAVSGTPAGLAWQSEDASLEGAPTTAGIYYNIVERSDNSQKYLVTIQVSASVSVREPVFISGEPLYVAGDWVYINYPQTVIPTLGSKLVLIPYSPINGVTGDSIGSKTLFSIVGGTAPYTTSSVSGVPTGLTLSNAANSGIYILSGTPSGSGTSTVNLTIEDATGAQASATAQIIVTTTVGASALPAIVANQASITIAQGDTVSIQAFTVSGGTAPLSVEATGLPSGLSISNTGLISGTVTAGGSFTVQATVTDANEDEATASLSLTVTYEVSPSSFVNNGGDASASVILEAQGSLTNYGTGTALYARTPAGTVANSTVLEGVGTTLDPYRVEITGEEYLEQSIQSMVDFVGVFAVRIDAWLDDGSYPLEQQIFELFPEPDTGSSAGKARLTLYKYGTDTYSPRFFHHDGTTSYKVEPRFDYGASDLIFVGIVRAGAEVRMWDLLTGENFTQTTANVGIGSHPFHIGRVQSNGTLTVFKAYFKNAAPADATFYSQYVAPAIAALNADKGYAISLPALAIADTVSYSENGAATLSASGGLQRSGANKYVFAKTGGSGNISVSSTGIVTGGTASGSPYSVSVRITDAAGQTTVETVTVTVGSGSAGTIGNPAQITPFVKQLAGQTPSTAASPSISSNYAGSLPLTSSNSKHYPNNPSMGGAFDSTGNYVIAGSSKTIVRLSDNNDIFTFSGTGNTQWSFSTTGRAYYIKNDGSGLGRVSSYTTDDGVIVTPGDAGYSAIYFHGEGFMVDYNDKYACFIGVKANNDVFMCLYDLELDAKVDEMLLKTGGYSQDSTYDMFSMGPNGQAIVMDTRPNNDTAGPWACFPFTSSGFDDADFASTTKVNIPTRHGCAANRNGTDVFVTVDGNVFNMATGAIIYTDLEGLGDGVSTGQHISWLAGTSCIIWTAGDKGAATKYVNIVWLDKSGFVRVMATTGGWNGGEIYASGYWDSANDIFRLTRVQADTGSTWWHEWS